MPRRRNDRPTLTLHKPSGQARVRILGRDYYCGPWGSTEAQAEYERHCRQFSMIAASVSTTFPESGTPNCVIYFLSSYEAVKIGHTDNLASIRRRVGSLQTGNARALKIVGLFSANGADEYALHRRFLEQKIRGEWFRFEAPIRAFLSTNVGGERCLLTEACKQQSMFNIIEPSLLTRFGGKIP